MSATVGYQLPLAVHLRDEATLENYLPPEDGVALLGALDQFLEDNTGQSMFLHGRRGSGKSHLLQACCHKVGPGALYLPLGALTEYPAADVLSGAEELPLVCLDDLQQVLGDPEWERALFNLFNGSRERGNALLLAAGAAPRNLDIALPDLRSRLSWGMVFHLATPDDERRADILQFRALQRGLTLSSEVASFLVNRAPRSMDSLLEQLEHLDRASLAQKRGLSIPFIKQILDL